MNQETLYFALPKGRILKELIPLMAKTGLIPEDDFFNEKSRKLAFNSNHEHIKIIRVRSFDVATFVSFGAAQLGIVGSDVLAEFNYDELYAPVDLEIGKCRLSVAEPANLYEMDDSSRWSHIRIATKYPHITSQYFAKKGVQSECVKLNGAMELAPKMGLCRRIVDLVSTGQTLKENGLKEIEVIMEVSSKLIAHRASYKIRTNELQGWIDKWQYAVDEMKP